MKHLALALPLLLAACDIGTIEPRPDAQTDACGASGYGGLIGTSIAAITLPADLDLRLIRPGEVVTMDFLPARLNFHLDAQGIVRKVSCG